MITWFYNDLLTPPPTLSNDSRIRIKSEFDYIMLSSLITSTLIPTSITLLLSRLTWDKVSFHSGSQASQQACVCDAHWYGNMVGTHSAKFWEGLRNSQSSHTCSTFANTHEYLGVVARYGNKKRRFAMLLCFGGTVLVLLFYVRGSKVWHTQSWNPLEMLVSTLPPQQGRFAVETIATWMETPAS